MFYRQFRAPFVKALFTEVLQVLPRINVEYFRTNTADEPEPAERVVDFHEHEEK
jgi:hypothetical protein